MPTILAIDDREDNLISINGLLKNLISGCTVLTALSGAEGIKKAKTEQVDTILLDIVTDGEHPMDQLEMLLSGDSVDRLLATLSETDRFIVEQLFAVNGGEPKTYLKISKELGISRERARQRCHRALTKLRMLANQKMGVY